MNCTELAATGVNVIALATVGAVALGIGLLLLLLFRARATAGALLVIAAAIVASLAFAPLGTTAAQATAAPVTAGHCSADTPDTLTIEQTSVMEGLAPTLTPTPIVGRATNVSTDDTYIIDVTVSIVSVTKAAGAVAGTCDATDYVILEPMMDVGVALAGGESTTFAGASIGFVDKLTNQDACQGATVRLLYTTG